VRKFLPLFVVTLLIVVSFTPVKGQGDATSVLEVSDQLSLNGMITITNVNSPQAGFVVIHADLNGAPGPVIGIAPVAAGPTENLPVMIDVGAATPTVYAALHTDDNTAGMFENEKNPDADPPVMADAQPLMIPFKLTAIRVYDQMINNNAASVAAVVSENGGWVVVSADNNGQPGGVLGQTQINPGTTDNVVVPFTTEGATPVLWVMLNVDDNTAGTFEFNQVEGADATLMVNDQMAALAFNSATTPTLMNAAGLPMAFAGDQLASLNATGQQITGDQATPTGLVIDSVFSVGPGWIDVHADVMGHPGPSLGVAPVTNGDNSGVTVPFTPEMMNPVNPAPVTPVVWPMLHTDDNQPNVYEYMMVVGADLPVIVNGQISALPVTVGVAESGDQGAAPAATQEAAPAATEEAVPAATQEVTAEATEAPQG